jgi:hypothetical protein
MHTTKRASFQGQIETVLRMSLSDLDLRIKNLFPVLRLKSHLTAAGIRKWDGYAPIHLMFVLVTLAFLKITSVHELMKQTVSSFYQARKDTFYRFKNGEWSWRPFYWRFIRHLGSKLKWSRTRNENCFIIDTSVLAKRGKSMEHVSYVYDHTQRKTVNGYELVAFGLITPTNFYPLDFCYRFSDKQGKQARDAAPLNPAGSLVKRIREAQRLTKIELAIKMLKEALAKGIVASHVLVDAWFTSPKFFQWVRHLNLHAVGRLKNGKTRYLYQGKWLSLSQLYHAMKDKLIKDPELGCRVATVSVECRNGVEGIIVFVKGYKEPEAETVAGVKRNPEPKWAAIFSTDPTLSARQVVKKYILRWSIEVFFKEAKQRLGLGKEQSRSFAAQVFSTTQSFLRYSILAYLLDKEPADSTIGEMFHQISREAGTLTFCDRLWGYFSTVLRRCLETMGQFLNLAPEFREYLDAISTAFKQVTPLQGCET